MEFNLSQLEGIFYDIQTIIGYLNNQNMILEEMQYFYRVVKN